MTIRVLLADDHVLFAEAIRELIALQPDIAVIATAGTGTEAVRKAVHMRPDVVLMDHFMPDVNGIEATRLIQARAPGVAVLMMSAGSSPEQVVRALRAGATGFVTKACLPAELFLAIREVHAGRHYIQRGLADAMLDQLLDPAGDPDPLMLLSPRERQVLQMIAEGRAMSAIAATLSLSVRTVETYRSRLMAKLGFKDLPALVRFAIKERLIPLD